MFIILLYRVQRNGYINTNGLNTVSDADRLLASGYFWFNITVKTTIVIDLLIALLCTCFIGCWVNSQRFASKYLCVHWVATLFIYKSSSCFCRCSLLRPSRSVFCSLTSTAAHFEPLFYLITETYSWFSFPSIFPIICKYTTSNVNRRLHVADNFCLCELWGQRQTIVKSSQNAVRSVYGRKQYIFTKYSSAKYTCKLHSF